VSIDCDYGALLAPWEHQSGVFCAAFVGGRGELLLPAAVKTSGGGI